MHWFVIVVAALHACFMLGELLPWDDPFILRKVCAQWLKGEPFCPEQQGSEKPKKRWFSEPRQELVAAIVHNAGIYNGIVAGGLFWAAFAGPAAADVARVLLIGATVAGVFGAITLKSPLIVVQSLAGIIGLLLLR